MIKAEAVRTRAYALFDFLLDEVGDWAGLDRKDEAYIEMSRIVGRAEKKLLRLDLFNVDRPVKERVLAELSPLERALYDYFRTAMVENPIFADLQKDLARQVLWERYRVYVVKGRVKAEQVVFEKVVDRLLEAVGLVQAPVGSVRGGE